jgi:hypothetical protein
LRHAEYARRDGTDVPALDLLLLSDDSVLAFLMATSESRFFIFLLVLSFFFTVASQDRVNDLRIVIPVMQIAAVVQDDAV